MLTDNVVSKWLHDPYPYAEEGADGLVVAGLQFHVAPVVELLNVTTPPQDPVAPRRDTTLTTAGEPQTERQWLGGTMSANLTQGSCSFGH